MAMPMTQSHLTLSDIERSKSRSLRFRSFVSCNEAEPYVTIKDLNRKAYMGSPLL